MSQSQTWGQPETCFRKLQQRHQTKLHLCFWISPPDLRSGGFGPQTSPRPENDCSHHLHEDVITQIKNVGNWTLKLEKVLTTKLKAGRAWSLFQCLKCWFWLKQSVLFLSAGHLETSEISQSMFTAELHKPHEENSSSACRFSSDPEGCSTVQNSLLHLQRFCLVFLLDTHKM